MEAGKEDENGDMFQYVILGIIDGKMQKYYHVVFRKNAFNFS